MTTPDPPDIPVFPAGHGPVTADFNNWIQTPFIFCTNGIMLRVEQRSSQSISTTTFTTITFDTVLEDPYSGWGSGAHKWTAPFSGWYQITLGWSVRLTSTVAGAAINITGVVNEFSQVLNTSTTMGGAGCSFITSLLGGIDTVAGTAWSQFATTTDTTSAGRFPWMEITFVSQ